MSCPNPTLPTPAALVANGGSARPEEEAGTPKDARTWQQQQQQQRAVKDAPAADRSTLASGSAADNDSSSSISRSISSSSSNSSSSSSSHPTLKQEPEAPKQAPEASRAQERTCSANHQESSGEQWKETQQQRQQQQQGPSGSVSRPSELPASCQSASLAGGSPTAGPTTAGAATSAAPPPPTSGSPSSSHARRGADRCSEWHPLDAVVERIESHVRPGNGGQRLQWCKGFRMPLGAEGRQILLRRLRKAYHSNPMRWDEELARHRIVFSRMPYATVIELFHLAHILGVFDFAVKCSEEYGSDASRGAGHRKRRTGRTAAATASAASVAVQQRAPGEGGGAPSARGTGEDGGGGPPRLVRVERKRQRRAPSFLEGTDVTQLHATRPKRVRRVIPSYLRDYETLAESYRLPSPPAKNGRTTSQASGAAGSALLSWSSCGKQDDLLAAALGGRECTSANEALLRALEEHAAAAAGGAAASYSPRTAYGVQQQSHQSPACMQEFADKIWGWGGSLGKSHNMGEEGLTEGTLGLGSNCGKLGGLRGLSELLKQEQKSKRDGDLTSGPKGRVFFSAGLPGGDYEEGEGSDRSRCNRLSPDLGPCTPQRRNRRLNASSSFEDVFAEVQPSLAELLASGAVKHQGGGAAATAAATAATRGTRDAQGSQMNLHLLTTNNTIAAQYLQVIELLAVQRQIMDLTNNLNKNRAGRRGAAAADTATAALPDCLLTSSAANAKLDYQTLLNQQLLLHLGAEAGLTTTTQQQQAAAAVAAVAAGAPAAQVSILKELEQKVAALESLAAERSAINVQSEAAAKQPSVRNTNASGENNNRCKRDLSRQSAISCSAPESPVDGYESVAASPCGSGGSFSACNTPDSLGSDRLLLLSSLWQPLPPAGGLAGATL